MGKLLVTFHVRILSQKGCLGKPNLGQARNALSIFSGRAVDFIYGYLNWGAFRFGSFGVSGLELHGVNACLLRLRDPAEPALD